MLLSQSDLKRTRDFRHSWAFPPNLALSRFSRFSKSTLWGLARKERVYFASKMDTISKLTPQQLEDFLLKRQYEKSVTKVMKGKEIGLSLRNTIGALLSAKRITRVWDIFCLFGVYYWYYPKWMNYLCVFLWPHLKTKRILKKRIFFKNTGIPSWPGPLMWLGV